MSDLLESIRKEKRERWLKDWREGLAYCLNCDHEYTNAQAITHNGEKSCPSCLQPEYKKYYYCPETGSNKCDCENH